MAAKEVSLSTSVGSHALILPCLSYIYLRMWIVEIVDQISDAAFIQNYDAEFEFVVNIPSPFTLIVCMLPTHVIAMAGDWVCCWLLRR